MANKRISELPLKNMSAMGVNDYFISDNEVEALSSKVPVSQFKDKLDQLDATDSTHTSQISSITTKNTQQDSRLNTLETARDAVSASYFRNATRLALGTGSNCGGDGVAIGRNASVGELNGIAISSIGYAYRSYVAHAKGGNAIAIGGRRVDAIGNESICIGSSTASLHNYSIALGYQATSNYSSDTTVGYSAKTSSSAGGGLNTAFGAFAVANNNNTNSGACALGYKASATQSNAIAIGRDALANGNKTLALGNEAYATGFGGGAFGYQAQNTTANRIRIGRSLSRLECFGTVINVSDRRDKTEIKDIEMGLDLINKLRPVEYRMNGREDYAEHGTGQDLYDIYDKEEHAKATKKSKRKFYGLIAQEVAEVLDPSEYNIVGDDHYNTDGEGKMHLSYDSFIAPLIKAVQELSAEVDELKKQVKKGAK